MLNSTPARLPLAVPGGVRRDATEDTLVLDPKAIVADDESVFLTSANLTEAALDRNIELGLLVRDAALALSITSQFRALIDRGLLRPLPGE